jgi:RNA polymerase sigma-70 factor (ECF subfamily)
MTPMHPDPAALMREHAAFVWRVLRYHGVRQSQLEDASQEVFLVVFRRLAEFEGRSSLRTWIYGICRHVAAVAQRKASERRELVTASPPERTAPASQDTELWIKQAHAQLQSALEALAEDQRAVFVLYEIEELSMDEIAENVGATASTCYSRLYAARSKVQALLRRNERAARASQEVAE